MHNSQHIQTVRADLAAVESYVRKLVIEVSHAQHALDELLRRLRTMEAVRDRLVAERAATVRGMQRQKRQAAQSRKWRESVPR